MTLRSILIAEIRFSLKFVKIMYAMNVIQNVNEIIQNSIHWFVYEPNIRNGRISTRINHYTDYTD